MFDIFLEFTRKGYPSSPCKFTIFYAISFLLQVNFTIHVQNRECNIIDRLKLENL